MDFAIVRYAIIKWIPRNNFWLSTTGSFVLVNHISSFYILCAFFILDSTWLLFFLCCFCLNVHARAFTVNFVVFAYILCVWFSLLYTLHRLWLGLHYYSVADCFSVGGFIFFLLHPPQIVESNSFFRCRDLLLCLRFYNEIFSSALAQKQRRAAKRHVLCVFVVAKCTSLFAIVSKTKFLTRPILLARALIHAYHRTCWWEF